MTSSSATTLSKKFIIAIAAFLSLSIALVPTHAQALSPTPTEPDDALLPALYEALDGNNWINNDGWLDPDLHWCDWYGVSCGQDELGNVEFSSLNLAGNGLNGSLSDEIIEYFGSDATLPADNLDLSDNAIEGALGRIPTFPRYVNLSNNQLSGRLPEFAQNPNITSGERLPSPIESLNLSNNLLSGMIPDAFVGSDNRYLDLMFLDLSNNQLEGSIEPALEAMKAGLPDNLGTRNRGLWLADNAFSGELDPAWFEDLELGSINLCWNPIEINDPDLDAWIAERHWGGDQNQCLGRERLALDPTVSGSWYDIHRPGEGLSVMLLDNGTPLVYWFSHISFNRQLWLFNTGHTDETTIRLEPLNRTRGEFDKGFNDLEFAIFGGGALRLDRVGPERLHAEFQIGYTGYDLSQPGDVQITWPPFPDVGFRSDHYQLTRLAGSRCDNQQPMQWASGAWFNPDRVGEGFVVEVIEDGRGLVYWFSYTPSGTNREGTLARSGDWQTWMFGVGQFVGDALIIEDLFQPRDTAFGMPGDIEGVQNIPFGKLTMQFFDDLSGDIDFVSQTAGYESANYSIERLARPVLAECE